MSTAKHQRNGGVHDHVDDASRRDVSKREFAEFDAVSLLKEKYDKTVPRECLYKESWEDADADVVRHDLCYARVVVRCSGTGKKDFKFFDKFVNSKTVKIVAVGVDHYFVSKTSSPLSVDVKEFPNTVHDVTGFGPATATMLPGSMPYAREMWFWPKHSSDLAERFPQLSRNPLEGKLNFDSDSGKKCWRLPVGYDENDEPLCALGIVMSEKYNKELVAFEGNKKYVVVSEKEGESIVKDVESKTRDPRVGVDLCTWSGTIWASDPKDEFDVSFVLDVFYSENTF